MMYTTLNRIREHRPCPNGWAKLLAHLGKTKADDEPLAMTTILDSNKVDDALWCLRAEPQHSAIWRLLAVHYARQVQHLMTDPRSLNALDVAERHAHGEATDDGLRAAGDAAWQAARDAEMDAAWYAAREAAWEAAREASWEAAWQAAGEAAWQAAGDAAWEAAWEAARYAAREAAWAAARQKQSDDLRTVLTHYHAHPGCEIHGWEGME